MTPTGRAAFGTRRLPATRDPVTYQRHGSGQTSCAESHDPPIRRSVPPICCHRRGPTNLHHMPHQASQRSYRLIGPDGTSYTSTTRGAIGGHRGTRIFGRLDCRAALGAIERGGPYTRFRVFFADQATAVSAGYRPCAVCMPAEYREWKKHAKR